jgi:hypothetical protein
MDLHAPMNPPPCPDPTPIRERPPLAGEIDQSRRNLAQLIGRLLARRWLRDHQGQVPDRLDPDELAPEGPP